jgi:hypothetical protein
VKPLVKQPQECLVKPLVKQPPQEGPREPQEECLVKPLVKQQE